MYGACHIRLDMEISQTLDCIDSIDLKLTFQISDLWALKNDHTENPHCNGFPDKSEIFETPPGVKISVILL